MTKQLYYQNPYQLEFDARVIGRIEKDHRMGIILDQTCFYPEGGGQPSDQGKLNQVRVYDVQKIDDNIVHFMDSELKTDIINGIVDGNRRHDFMQQHTGQHILSQALVRIGKYNTVSVHFGDTYTAIETDATEIPAKSIQAVEKLANEVIRNNLPVNILWVDPEQVEQFNIRRPPPDVEKVRIVQVGDFDASACGGLHMSHTGEVGIVKITGQEKIRGRTRIHVKIGNRALEDYSQKTEIFRELGILLTCGEDVLVKRVIDLQQQLKNAQRDVLTLQSARMTDLAEAAISKGKQIRHILFVQQILQNADHNLLKIFADRVLTLPGRLVVVFGTFNGRLNWMVSHSLGQELNLALWIKDLLPLIDAKGGGSPLLVQGVGQNPEGIQKFIENVIQKLERIESSDE
ncbi:MAG: hypothetical protein JSW33_09595 [bacterium]|nr:MAG: hypothetical protein JSW33_09595 [bacterium]